MPGKIDFSKMERLTPRADSWDKVCARLDAEQSERVHKKGNIISIRPLYSAIPLAASLVLISLTAILPAYESSAESISIQNAAPSEITSWYEGLGNSGNDEFNSYEESIGLSYLIKE